MRKLSLLLAICMLLVCFASCGDDDTKTPVGTDAPTVTTEKPDDNKEPEKEKETDPYVPETPQDKWTERY